jgi:hypothetical protein
MCWRYVQGRRSPADGNQKIRAVSRRHYEEDAPMGMLRGRNMDKTSFTPIPLRAASACLLSLTRYCPANGSLGNPVSPPLDLTRIPPLREECRTCKLQIGAMASIGKGQGGKFFDRRELLPRFPHHQSCSDVCRHFLVEQMFSLLSRSTAVEKKKAKITPLVVSVYLSGGALSCSLYRAFVVTSGASRQT